MRLDALDHMPNAEVVSPDGTVGQLAMLGVKPQTDDVTHLIVRRGFLFQRDLMIPVDLVEDVSEDNNEVKLKAPLSEVVEYPEYKAPPSLMSIAWELAWLPWKLVLRTWRERRFEAQEQLIETARRQRAQDLVEHGIFDKDVEGPPERVDLNRASVEELAMVKGIGERLAQQIVDHRPYESLDDLARRVHEISPQTLERLREVAKC